MEYAPDGPTWRGSGAEPLTGSRPLRTPLAAAGSRDRRLGPERGAPPPLAPALSASVPSPSREAPDGAAATRRRLAAGMVLSGGQRAPAPGAVAAPAPRAAPAPASPPRRPARSGPPPAFARSPGTGVIRRLCCHGRCRNRLRAPAAPAPPCCFPEPGPGAARGPRDAVAVRAYLSPVRPQRGVRGRQSRAAWPNCPRRRRLCPALLLLAACCLLLPPRSVSPARRRAAAAGLFLSGYVKVT